jgi:hypothetical protein
LVVHVNSYNEFCVKLHLYDAEDAKHPNATVLARSQTNELLISPSDESRNYVVELVGHSACSYEISYTSVSEKVFELVPGHSFLL